MTFTRRPRKYRVLFDMDGMKANLFKKWFAHYNRDYNANLTIDQVHSPNIRDVVPIGAKMDEYIRAPGFYRDLEVLPGAKEAVAELIAMERAGSRSLELLICSSPGRAFGCVKDKAEWLDENFPELYYRERIFTSAKYVCKANALLDDSPENIFHWKNEFPEGHAIAIAYPYNESVADICALRAESWQDTFKAWEQIVAFIKEDVARFYS